MTAWRSLPRSSVSAVVKVPSVGPLPGSATAALGQHEAAGGWGATAVGTISSSGNHALTAAATALAATSHRPCTIIAKGATKLVRVTPPVDLTQRPQFNWRQQPHDSPIQKLSIGERAAACADTLQLTSWTLVRKQQQVHQQVVKRVSRTQQGTVPLRRGLVAVFQQCHRNLSIRVIPTHMLHLPILFLQAHRITLP